MAQAPHNMSDPPEVLTTEEARAGRTGNKVRYVLLIGTVLAVVLMVIAYFDTPAVPDDRPNSAALGETAS